MMTTAVGKEERARMETITFSPGVVLNTKKDRAGPLLLPEVSESESELEEFVEEMQVFVSDSGHVERLELLGDTLPAVKPSQPPAEDKVKVSF